MRQLHTEEIQTVNVGDVIVKMIELHIAVTILPQTSICGRMSVV